MKGAVAPEAITIAKERQPAPPPEGEGGEYIRAWQEKEGLGGEVVDAFVLILRTSGCYWARSRGCTMCGYARETLGREATKEEILSQVKKALEKYRGEPYVKIYTSGSFLDPSEVPVEARSEVAALFGKTARRLLIESLPEFITPESVGALKDSFGHELEIALGLETTQDEVLKKAVTKVSTVKEYLDAAAKVREAGAFPKAYLLLKPPFLTEEESMADTIRSIGISAQHFSTISINPVHIQGGTLVERLWRKGLYRPPWLWSLREVMLRGREVAGPSVRLVSFPTSGGNERGVHNCLSCDGRVLRAVERSSVTQDFDALEDVDTCSCTERWSWENSLEALSP